MNDYVHLFLKRNRGWPTPEDSWGLTPMFGVDGWCHSCGIPLRDQCGPLTLKRGGLSPLAGAFVPNWRFDAICLEAALASRAQADYALDVREVAWKGTAPGKAVQLVIPSVGASWYEREPLTRATTAKHGTAGSTCGACGTWRWWPLGYSELPPLIALHDLAGFDIAASPEWFGAGHQSFRQILVRRELAELIVAASPRDFKVQEPR